MIQKRIQEQAQSQKERETDFLCKICPVKKYKSESDVQPSKHDAQDAQGQEKVLMLQLQIDPHKRDSCDASTQTSNSDNDREFSGHNLPYLRGLNPIPIDSVMELQSSEDSLASSSQSVEVFKCFSIKANNSPQDSLKKHQRLKLDQVALPIVEPICGKIDKEAVRNRKFFIDLSTPLKKKFDQYGEIIYEEEIPVNWVFE